MQDQTKMKKLAEELLKEIGENPKRNGLKDTPKRMAKMWTEIFKGYDKRQMPQITVFANDDDGIVYDQIITDEGTFHSHCEHHMAVFYGQYYFGYIPDKHIIGLSKIARIIDYFSSRLQVQERLGSNVLDYLEKKLQPKGLILIMKAHHTCKEMRGVKKNGLMTTSVVRGTFANDASAKEEFLKLINLE